MHVVCNINMKYEVVLGEITDRLMIKNTYK